MTCIAKRKKSIVLMRFCWVFIRVLLEDPSAMQEQASIVVGGISQDNSSLMRKTK